MIKAVLFDCIGVLYMPKGFLSGSSLNQELLDFSQSLRPQLKVGLLTNLSAGSLDKYFVQQERQKYFDDVVVSDEVGLIKPAQDIYKYAASRLGVEVGECVLIDDSQVNCDGAVKAGMQAVLYKSVERCKSELATLLS